MKRTAANPSRIPRRPETQLTEADLGAFLASMAPEPAPPGLADTVLRRWRAIKAAEEGHLAPGALRRTASGWALWWDAALSAAGSVALYLVVLAYGPSVEGLIGRALTLWHQIGQ